MAAVVDLSKVDTSDPLVNRHIEKSQIRVEDIEVSKILVHPIKSFRGTSVTEASYTPQGIQYDRDWCIIDTETHAVLTARDLATTVLVTPRIEVDASLPYGGLLVVDVPKDPESKSGGCDSFSVPLRPTPDMLKTWPHFSDIVLLKKYPVDGYVVQPLNPSEPSPHDILSRYFNRKVLLTMKGPQARLAVGTPVFATLSDVTVKYQDGYPLSIASEESVEAVNAALYRAVSATDDPSDPNRVAGLKKEKWHDRKLYIERFRPNIVFKGAGVPFAEDLWREIVIGDNDTSVTVLGRCDRCLLPNVDEKTADRDTAVPYKVMLKFGKDAGHKPMLACNAGMNGNGVFRVGDRVVVKRWIEQVV
ncbi:hypothetical protein BXZ70DRAFT_217455 [Cristinia sonorae]|uniref:MOSC domain-containing protein n=1 Tax=Cristinia sonorae TaxID=1940300 RepID=A0A8K0UN95_9AGAR|nr:hypothetical protein BXZ70DRAFT_217455 [Cristinia sonorae]